MKHTFKITALILAMFLITQLIGLAVINHYGSEERALPYGMGLYEEESSQEIEEDSYNLYLYQLIFSFIFAIALLLIFLKFKLNVILKFWFFMVITIALGLFFYSLTESFDKLVFEIPLFATSLALFLAYFKIFQRNFLIHNFTELLIYPGIAAVFVPILNITTIIILLILISFYDMWAVWKSGIMQKMAKYQINELNIFSGFFIPYISKAIRNKIKYLKKSKKNSELKKIKVNMAILGGGDVVFPIITSGVVLKFMGIFPALLVIFGAFFGLAGLLLFSNKKKFYPAMPFITAGIFLGLIIGKLFF
jgi:presenilin-like A22 family membrane protease